MVPFGETEFICVGRVWRHGEKRDDYGRKYLQASLTQTIATESFQREMMCGVFFSNMGRMTMHVRL